jgi:LEA14-like dessication related protein
MVAGLAMLAAMSATGCAFQKPTLKFKTVHLREVDLEGTTLDVVYTLKNPNPVGLKLATVDYALEVEGRQVVSGKPARGLSVRQNGATELVFPARVKFQDIVPTVQVFLKQDTAKYRASGAIGIQTPIGVVKLPLSHSSTFPVPKIPDFDFQTPVISGLSLSGARLTFPIKITNKNPFALPLKSFSAGFTVAGTKIGSTRAELAQAFAPQQSQVVNLPIDINFMQVGTSVANALRTRRALVKLDGALQSGGISLPIEMSKTLDFR